MNRIKNVLFAAMLGLVAMLTPAHAAGESFDSTVFTGTLSAGLSTVGTLAAGIAAICASVMVWKKVAKYFSKAG